MPTQDESARSRAPLERVSPIEVAHATCPTDDDCVTATSQASAGRTTLGSALNNALPSSLAEPNLERPARGDDLQASAGAAELSPASTETSSSASQSAGESPPSSQDAPSPASAERLAKQYDDSQLKATRSSAAQAATPFSPPPRRALTPPETYRVPQHTSSFLRHGSRFVGTQKSDRQNYEVTVDLKHVDMRESFLCGFLHIKGLTDRDAVLTTYFEGEIIGNKYTFQTSHPDWGSNMKVDMQHWQKFPAWAPLARQAHRDNFSYRDYAEREHLFMRWKEHFLVPDHRVTQITGASFEGFYFICFNQIKGTIEGIYFHAKSEKFQKLELHHVHDYGRCTAQEFA